MPRPPKPRSIRHEPSAVYFKPAGVPLRGLREVLLGRDELEALRLADLENLPLEDVGALMNVSRATAGRILAEARRCMACALAYGHAIRVEGGVIETITDPSSGPSRGEVKNMTTIEQGLVAESADLQWEPAEGYAEGTQQKVLRRGADGKPKTLLLQLAPGFDMGSHSHRFAEHHYVLRGEYHSQRKRFGEGTYRFIPAHADHGPFRSDRGAELLVIWAD